MKITLRILGWLSIAGGVILGLALRTGQNPESVAIFLTYTIGGIISSIAWFALAQILQRHDELESEMDIIHAMLKRSLNEKAG